MRHLKITTAALIASLGLQPLGAFACISMPKVFTNTTASYARDYSFKVESGGGFKMTFIDQVETERLSYLNPDALIERWSKKHEELPKREFDKKLAEFKASLNKDGIDRERKEAQADLDAKAKPMIVFNDGEICFTSSAMYKKDPKNPKCISDKLKDGEELAIPNKDNPVAFIRKGQGGAIMVLGVAKSGGSDMKNSMVISPGAEGSGGRGAIVRTYTEGRLDGEAQFDSMNLTRSLSAVPSLPLNGKSYLLKESSQCGGSLEEADYREGAIGQGSVAEDSRAVGEPEGG